MNSLAIIPLFVLVILVFLIGVKKHAPTAAREIFYALLMLAITQTAACSAGQFRLAVVIFGFCLIIADHVVVIFKRMHEMSWIVTHLENGKLISASLFACIMINGLVIAEHLSNYYIASAREEIEYTVLILGVSIITSVIVIFRYVDSVKRHLY